MPEVTFLPVSVDLLQTIVHHLSVCTSPLAPPLSVTLQDQESVYQTGESVQF